MNQLCGVVARVELPTRTDGRAQVLGVLDTVSALLQSAERIGVDPHRAFVQRAQVTTAKAPWSRSPGRM